MSNMSYCRFRNTLSDLQDCLDHLDESLDDAELEPDEKKARDSMLMLIFRTARDYEHEEERISAERKTAVAKKEPK